MSASSVLFRKIGRIFNPLPPRADDTLHGSPLTRQSEVERNGAMKLIQNDSFSTRQHAVTTIKSFPDDKMGITHWMDARRDSLCRNSVEEERVVISCSDCATCTIMCVPNPMPIAIPISPLNLYRVTPRNVPFAEPDIVCN